MYGLQIWHHWLQLVTNPTTSDENSLFIYLFIQSAELFATQQEFLISENTHVYFHFK